MQHFTSKKLLRVLAMVLVLVMALGCFAACGNDGSHNGGKDDDDKGSSNGNKVSYEWNGLRYSLSKDFKDTGIGGDQYGSYSNDTLILTVADDTTPDGVTDSQSYARYYENQMSSIGSVSVASANGVYYTVVDYGDGTMEARGFYVDGDHCWVMYITSYDYEQHSSKIVSIITSGTIGSYSGNNGGSDTGNNSGSNGNTGNNGNSGNISTPDQPNLPTPGDMNQHSFEGLTYYIGKEYSASNNGSYMMHSNGSTAIMVVSGKAPNGVADAKAFAQLYIGDMAESDFTCKLDSSNGVPYTVTEWGDGTTEVRAFYLYNGYGWNIYATSYDYSSESSELIRYVTSGVIDKNYQHNTGNGDSSNNGNTSPNNPVDPGTPSHPGGDDNTDIPSNPDHSDNPNTNETKLISVYTLAPADWGTLRCWAWKDGGEDVFDAWPGETMLWIGKYYAANIPDWADHVIINGNDGTTKTEDILIKPGKNVWIIIHADGQYYSIFYSYPTNAQLSELGY